MRKMSLIIAILGILALLTLMNYLPAREISVEEINDTMVNARVTLEGKVEIERIVGDLKIWKINGIEVVCDDCESFKDKNVSLLGVVEDYNGKQVRVLRIAAE